MLSKIAFVSIAIAAAFASAQPSYAEMKTKKVKATREQVAKACEAADGVGYGYGADHGSYGCVTDNGFIDCKENGKCVGGTVSRISGRGTMRAPGSVVAARR